MISWFATVKGKQVLVASANVVFRATGRATVKVKLTSKGRQLFKVGKKLKITISTAFTPTGGATTRSTRSTPSRASP